MSRQAQTKLNDSINRDRERSRGKKEIERERSYREKIKRKKKREEEYLIKSGDILVKEKNIISSTFGRARKRLFSLLNKQLFLQGQFSKSSKDKYFSN